MDNLIRSYITNPIETVELLLLEDGKCEVLKYTSRNPFPSNSRPDLDVTEELVPELLSWYLQLVGILRWDIELGRIDIFHETSLMSQYHTNTSIGHLEVLYHILAYLKSHMKMGRICYDPMRLNVNFSVFNNNTDWMEFYGDVQEYLPPNIPEPRGIALSIYQFVDADRAGNVVTRRSHTDIIIFIQKAPIIWFSKKNNLVKADTFGNELVALRIRKNLIVTLRYTLRMFSVRL